MGLPEGLVARFDDESISVLLRGPLPALNALAAGGVRAIVDAAGLEAGSANSGGDRAAEQRVELPVDVQAEEGVRVVTVQPPVLSVTLSRPR